MPGFNTSTRKEDISLKLKAQHFKNARDQTKRLEEDNRKMEERLKELKTVMKREKEQRERQGAGFWGRGQSNTGSLTNYASEVLQNKSIIPPLEGKIKKVKVLRDEPLDKPKKIGPPGTMKYIAQRKLATNNTTVDKQKFPKCGQCEDRAATLSCVQCSEIYCPGCFSAFHLKGALKQHRSVPLSASGPRVCMSPCSSTDSNTAGECQASGAVQIHEHNDMNGSEAVGALTANTTYNTANTLLNGDYDESQSAASFQAALLAWRHREQPVTQQSARCSLEKQVTPAMVTDESIGTSEETQVLDIKFKSTLTYAEKLLLKEHSRMKLAAVSPELGTQPYLKSGSQNQFWPGSQNGDDHSVRQVSQLHSPGSFSKGNMTTDSVDNIMVTSTGEEDHVDFQSLFEAVTLSESPDKMGTICEPKKSDISIVDMYPQKSSTSEMSNSRLSVAYVVKEVSALESWKTEHMQLSEKSFSPAVVDKKLWSKSQIVHNFDDIHLNASTVPDNHPEFTREISSLSVTNPPQDRDLQNCPIICEIYDDSSESRQQNSESAEQQFKEELTDLEILQSPVSLEKKSIKPLSRPISGRFRPKSARSKMSKASRTLSRAGYEGHLTKGPSLALKNIAQLTQAEYPYISHSPLDGFFLLGVEGNQPVLTENRILTPSRDKSKTEGSVSRLEATKKGKQEKGAGKISNRLYQMCPRSWHPESSLFSAVPQNEVGSDIQGKNMTLSFAYSKQINGQGFEWSSSSNQNIENRSSDALHPTSILTFDAETVIRKTDAECNSHMQLYKRSAGHEDKEIHSETCDSDDKILSPSHQTSKELVGRRFHSIAAPTSSSDVFKGFKMQPMPPDLRQGHGLSSEVSLSVPVMSKQIVGVKNNENVQKSNTKSRSSIGEENVNLSKQSTRFSRVKDTLKGSFLLDSRPYNSKTRKNQSSSGVGTSSILASQTKHEVQSEAYVSKTEADIHNQVMNKLSRVSNRMSPSKSEIKSSRRPNSSTTQPTNNEFQKPAGTPRPNSSSGGSDPLRKSQQCLQSAGDTIIMDMMKSRIHEDGWVDDDIDCSYNYDDGDDLTSVCLHMSMTSLLSKRNSDQWETEVRPFSGLSLGLKTGHSENKVMSAKGDCKPSSGPHRCRVASEMSKENGRFSRAIVVDGDDLSYYDSLGIPDEQDMVDNQTLDQLEWELASNTGRLTADGSISRMSTSDVGDVDSPSKARSLKMENSEKEYDISAQIIKDERQAERNIEKIEWRRNATLDDVDEVRALR